MTFELDATGCEQTLALLRQEGAASMSPVDFHYMEALARRMRSQGPQVQRILEARLVRAVVDYQARWDGSQRDGVIRSAQNMDAIAEARSPLGQLIQSLEHAAPMASCANDINDLNGTVKPGLRTELKSVGQFRNTWSALSAQRQVSQALNQAPKNAGPINSHMLVLKSLELMRKISPDYLNRFMSYADTLLCLEQSELSAKTTKAKTTNAKPLASAKPRARTPIRRSN